MSLLREEQFEALLGWCKRTIYDRHAPGRFGDRREAKARFAELEESDFLGHGYEVFRQGIIAFSRGLDLNPNQGVPDIERLILSRQRRTPYWEAAYMLQEGLIPEDSAEAFAPLNATSSAASYRRSDESVDAELRQNYLLQLSPEQRVSLLDGMFGCTAYYDLSDAQRRELLAYFQSTPQQQQEVVYA
ncbi:MAG: hypothetical protein O3A14_09780 [Cyanobacteria bacterium]|nr:hypothetical protein [Cyanobacteriota bacterium]